MTRVIVSGALANKPRNGGNAWAVLSWVRGLADLGCDVYFVEQLSSAALPGKGLRESDHARFYELEMNRFALSGRSALFHEEAHETLGLAWPQLVDLAASADLLVNITGHLTSAALLERIPRKAYLDFDPGYTQFWHADGISGSRLEGHDYFFTLGENIGRGSCCIPSADFDWRPTRQPVVLADWPVTEAGSCAPYSTVASWRGAYGRVEYGGRSYGQKVHEFRKILEVPLHLPEQRFEIALDVDRSDEADIALLRRSGWWLRDPREVVPSSASFRDFVQASRAEVSAAQSIYVQTNNGWFSDRTVRYLASGKPAIVQDTGFSRNYPVGEGLFAYRCPSDIESAVREIELNYDKHSRAARRLAETYFDSTKVLTQFLEEMDLAP